jgi:UDP-glucose 4-epimerase
MKVLVTGAAGFIGTWTTSQLVKEGHEVTATDLAPKPGVVQIDITQLDEVNDLVKQVKPDAVIHLAAISGSTGQNEIEQSMRQAYLNYKVNVLGTVNVCEAIRRNAVRFVIYMSSFAVYGRTGPERLPIREETPVSLEHAYANSKYAGELVVRNYSADFGIRSVVFRTPFIVGEGQIERNMVREFVEAAFRGDSLLVFGDGSHVREFLHPEDLVAAYNSALGKMAGGKMKHETIVLGNAPVSMKDLAVMIIEETHQGKLKMVPDTLSRAFNQYSDYSEARRILNWQPTMGTRQIVNRVVRQHSDKGVH